MAECLNYGHALLSGTDLLNKNYNLFYIEALKRIFKINMKKLF